MDFDDFEMIFVVIVLACAIIVAVAQVNLRTKYNEKALKRQTQYSQFLQQTDHRSVFTDHYIKKEKRWR